MRGLHKIIFAAAIAVASAGTAVAADLQKVTIGVGTRVLNVTYPWLMMPKAKGYWRELGYDVDVITISGSLEAVQLLAAGKIDFAQMNASAVIQANAEKDIPLRLVLANGVTDWSLVTLKDGDIKEPSDLAGKTVGVFSLASSGVPLVKAYLTEQGVDPASVNLVATGAGAPALLALQNGSVQALMFWGSMNVAFENMGADLRYFYSKGWREMPDFSLATTQEVIDRDPDMVKAIAKGVVMGTEFAFASPECTRKTHWANFPDTKPGNAPDEATAIKWDDTALAASMESLQSAKDAGGGELWGAISPDSISMLQTFLLDTGQITKTLAPETYIIDVPNFFADANDVDEEAVRKDAEACELP